MLIEQETASIMAFALEKADNPTPYYYDVPESFVYPSMYFPQPEILTAGETLGTHGAYAMRYAWYINIFSETTEEAFKLAWQVLTALKQKRNLVPLVDEDLNPTGEHLRLNDPSVKTVDTGVAQLTLTWTSRRPYDREDVDKMVYYDVEYVLKSVTASTE